MPLVSTANRDSYHPIRVLNYDDDSHWKVLTQSYGSVWPRVLPYCLANVALTAVVYYLKHFAIVDLTSDPLGSRYLSLLMSFLVVTRVKITYDNYMWNARCLSQAFQAIRDLVQWTCVLTMSDTSAKAKQWRHDVAYAAIVLLRVTVAVLEFRSNPDQVPWQVPELPATPENRSFLYLNKDVDDPLGHLAPEERTSLDEAYRAPVALAHQLRQQIMKQRDGHWLKPGTFSHPCNEELRLLDFCGAFLKQFSGLKIHMTTPLPFPLVQLTKTSLFVWIFTLPFYVCHTEYRQAVLCFLIVFLITFGFIGLEFVAMELSDNFGDDAVDFDDLGYAQLCFEDCYIAIYKLDGENWARKLKQSFVGGVKTELEAFREMYQSGFWDGQIQTVLEDEDGEAGDSTSPLVALRKKKKFSLRRLLPPGLRGKDRSSH